MLVAKEKAKENVGEYLIYMFQIEDLIRACKFEKQLILNNLVGQYQADENTRKEIETWYMGLAELMEQEELSETGHLSFITNKINELNDFHLYLLQAKDHNEYKDQYKETEPALQDFASKQNEKANNVVKLILNAIYSYYLLNLKKQEISKETTQAIGQFSLLLNSLSKKFKAYEKGETKIFDD